MNRLALVLLCALSLVATACPKNTVPADAGIAQTMSADAEAPPRPPEVDDLWARANDADGGTEDDLSRLARREGVTGLVERGAHPSWRAVAAQALGYTEGFAALPWLTEVGATDSEAVAMAALESATRLAAQVRTQTDPEDAEELRAGCDRLLALACDAKAEKKRRVLAIRALRMLNDRGCVKSAEVPAELDAR